MRATIVVAYLAMGCYNPTAGAGAPCGAGEPCPSGQSCVRDRCRIESTGEVADAPIGDPVADAPTDAFVPDGPPTDVDADGVLNADDNCPGDYNTDQHDEDGDGPGDVCDNCPHIPNPMQENALEPSGQSDEVGDACDPRPMVGGDTIERFIGFQAMPADLATPEGSWSIVGDSLRQSANIDTTLLLAGARDRVVVEVAGMHESNTPDLLIIVTMGEANGEYHDCGYYDEGGNPTDFHNAMIEYYDGSSWDVLAGNHELPDRLNGAFTIRGFADSTNDRITCFTSDARGPASSTENNADNLVAGGIGVRSYGAVFRLDYLIVYGQP